VEEQMMRCVMFFYPLFAWMLAAPCLAQAAGTGSEPQAVFKRLQDFVGSNVLDFKTSVDARDETLGTTRGSVHYLIKRPNLFRIEGTIGGDNYALVSDGQVMTIYNAGEHKFTDLPAPESAAGGMSILTGLASIESQVLKFVGVLDDVAKEVKGVTITASGSETIGDRQCDRFKIVESSDDGYSEKWDVWLERKEVPLPCRFVVSGSSGLARDVQTNEFSWVPNPAVTAETFKFDAPKGSVKVGSVGELGLRPPIN
jgi:outer membrane lipoprotein-sorting protein